jgi:hypothetical protein
MQLFYGLPLVLIASAAAQATVTLDGDIAALPECAKTCFGTAMVANGCPSNTGMFHSIPCYTDHTVATAYSQPYRLHMFM